MSEIEVRPTTAFRVFTLNDDYSPRTHMGGAGDAPAATMIACTIATGLGVSTAVLDEQGTIVAHLALVEEA